MSYKIYPYKSGSKSAKALRDGIGGLMIKLENSKYRYRDNHTVINWGNSKRIDRLEGAEMLNAPERVAVAANKLTALQELEELEVPTVAFTTDKSEAQEWLEDGEKVFVRNKLNGHSGEGIQVVEGGNRDEAGMFAIQEAQRILDGANLERVAEVLDEEYSLLAEQDLGPDLPNAPLYTKGVENKGEYRVHVFDGDIILYQKKSRRVDDDGEVITAEGEDSDVRNLESGWIYRTGNLKQLERIQDLAVSAVEALDLDFGAVDIIMDNEGEVFVLEVNSAPGLGNTDTLEAYVEAFNNY